MKSDLKKCHLTGTICNLVEINVGSHFIHCSREEKLLETEIYLQLLVESNVTILCKRASQKLHAFSRITNNMDFEKRKCLMKTFIVS